MTNIAAIPGMTDLIKGLSVLGGHCGKVVMPSKILRLSCSGFFLGNF